MGRYRNLDDVNNKKSVRELRQWMKERKSKVKDLTVEIPQADHKEIDFLRSNRHVPAITWIGHSTFLIQLAGLNIITDPVWARRMGFQKRLTEPGIALFQLPDIDVVLISHGHYDHLDFPTLRKLPGNPKYLVPAGLRGLFERKGLRPAVELEWWQSTAVSSVGFTFVPAQHWTRRSVLDMNKSHWGGWMMQTEGMGQAPSQTLYFVGDTGYFRGFKEIADRFAIDYVLMPIGAYEPEWFMKDSHINPEDSVTAFIELGADRFIPMHYGAYRLADDTGPEALERLLHAWQDKQLDDARLNVLKLGETIRI